MDKDTSYKIIRDTLQNSFDKSRFLSFAKNLLNQIDESKTFQYSGAYIPEAFRKYVRSFERLGTYTDPEGKKIDVLIVYLQKETSLERARTAQRNFVARHLKERDEKDAGLVAFVSSNLEDWRFSLINMEYKFTEGKAGKVKVKEEFTPARRWSFLVGANENSHTAQSRLAPVLQEDEFNPTQKVLEDAFNIEKVTKEFFEKYRDLFLRVKETLDEVVEKDSAIRKDFTAKAVDSADFSKKLLGQIVFLYFLQKKGWFGVSKNKEWGTGSKRFIRDLFDTKVVKYKNFFNDVLEPLFYDALARDRSDIDHYNELFKSKIPFLNGGLFDPINNYDWVNTDIILPNDLFSNERKTKEGDIGDGILDVFDRYNFTVKEDEPLEKEVAVDPEMLGKVFENLLEVKDRKSKGTYYTPREIVHYMCQQSLTNYLDSELEGKADKEDIETLICFGETAVEHDSRVKNHGKETPTYSYKLPEKIRANAELVDEKLASIRVCDPAIGSGAFPVGMMNEIVRARDTLTTYIEKKRNRTIYDFKRHAIQNCLYGVDIDPGAVEIAKLRLWLSLVVDEDDIKQIKPLPNLDYKIMQGNSLLEEFEGVKLFDEKLISGADLGKGAQIEKIKAEIDRIQKEYIRLHSNGKLIVSKKQELDHELGKLNSLLKKLTKPEKTSENGSGLFDSPSRAKEKANELKALHREFFEASQKSRKEQIKKRIETLEWELIEETLKEQGKQDALKMLQRYKQVNAKPFFLWRLNFAEVFEEKGGFDVAIANPPYVFARNSTQKGITEKDKEYFYAHYELAEYQVNLYPLFIEQATRILRENGCLTFITPNNWLTINTNRILRRFVLEKSDITIVNFYARVFESANVDSAVVIFTNGRTRPEVRLCEYTDRIYFIRKAKSEFFLKQKDHVINIEAFKTGGVADLLAKIEQGSVGLETLADVKAGLVAYEVGKGTPPQTKAMKEKRVYHTTKKLGADYYKYLDGKDVCRYHLGWSGEYLKYGANLAAPRNDFNLYSTQRILVRQIPAKPPYCIHACMVEVTYLNDRNSMNIINMEEKPELLLGIINSRLISFWFIHKFGKLQRGIFPQFKVNELAIFPIVKDRALYKNQIVQLVKKIMDSKISDQKTDTTKWDCQIDQLVYELYGLTTEEIKIVEGEKIDSGKTRQVSRELASKL